MTPRDLARRAHRDDVSAGFPAAWSQIDQPVGGGDHIKLVLDHHDRVSQANQLLEDHEQALDVGEMQARRRFVEDVQHATASGPAELGGQLDALGFATRKSRARLPQRKVAKPDVMQRLEWPPRPGYRIKQLEAFIHPHGQNVSN